MIQFPKIRGKIETGEGVFPIPQTLCADTADFAPWCVEVFARRLGLSQGAGKPWLTLCRDTAIAEEGYRLDVTADGVHVAASTERGVVWALTTLYLRTDARQVRCCRIADAPRYPHRGQSMDVVRHFFPAEEIKKLLEQMSLVKMNVLHFHLTDDQGWRIESKRFPQLQSTSPHYYTQAQLKELVDYARIRGIEIIPEVDLPGHTTAILAACPELGCTGQRPALARSGGIYTTILCPGQERVYRFLEELLEEICAIFPAERFHIGGDEAPKHRWKTCPHCLAAMERLGYTDFEQLQGYFTRRVAEILKQNGKKCICWNETLNGYPDVKDIQIQFWTLDAPEKMDAYAAAGGAYIYSDMCELYLDYPYSMTGVRKLYKMRPHIWTRRCGKDPGLIGIESTLWTEHIADNRNLEEHLFPRLYIVAEKAWSGGHGRYGDFLSSLRQLCDLAKREGIVPMAESGWNPAGRERWETSRDFFMKMNGGVLEDVPEDQAPAQPNMKLMASYVARFFRVSDLPELYKIYFG